MSVTVGAKGIDFSFAHLDIDDIARNGARFVIRYSGGYGRIQNPGDVGPKLCRKGDIAAAVRAGMDFIANSEWYEGRITEGSGAGAQDGAADLAFWQDVGLHRGASIYVSWDAAPLERQFDAVASYLQAYDRALDGVYKVDLYAGDPAIREMKRRGIINYGWRPNAGSWSGDPDGHYYQRADLWHEVQNLSSASIWQNGNYWYTKHADENIILQPHCGSHLQAAGGAGGVINSGPPTPEHEGSSAVTLRRGWPTYMHGGDYFGLVTGPAQSHGGYYAIERPDVFAIQQRLQTLGYAPKAPGWADGVFEKPTLDAVAAWQHAHMPGTQFYGQVWQDDWTSLFTY